MARLPQPIVVRSRHFDELQHLVERSERAFGLFLAQFGVQLGIALTHHETSFAPAQQSQMLTQISQIAFSALSIALALFIIFNSREKRESLRTMFSRTPQTV